MYKSIIFFMAIAVSFYSCKKDEKNETKQAKVYKVQYAIGCSDCMVAYVADTAENQITEYNKNSNWSYSFFGKKNQSILLLAYNTSDAPEAINVKIMVNDSIVKDKTTFCPISGVSFAVDTLR